MFNNRVAMGILTGAGTGATAGIAAGPWGMLAGAAIGGIVGGISGEEANKEAWSARQQAKAQAQLGADKESAEARKMYDKRRSAMGIADSQGVGASDNGGSIISGNNSASGLTSLV